MKIRSTEIEKMETEKLDESEMAAILKQVTWLNSKFGSLTPLFGFLESAAQSLGPELSVMDLGCGQGDLLFQLISWSQNRKLKIRWLGIDLNPKSVALAKEKLKFENVEIICGDALQFFSSPHEKPDVYVSTLFAHHLSDLQIVELIQGASDTANWGWYFEDLQRHALSREFLRGLTWALGFHSVVQNDSVVSVKRSFRKSDWQKYLLAAKVDTCMVKIQWRWAFKYSIEFQKSGAKAKPTE